MERNGADWSDTGFSEDMNSKGFVWNEKVNAFINEKLEQVVSVNSVGGVSIKQFNVLWLDEQGNINEKAMDKMEMFDSTGLKGTIKSGSSTESKSNKLSQEYEDKIRRKGFSWNDSLDAYVKNLGEYYQEKIIVEPTGTIKYYYVNSKGNTKMFDSTNPQAVVNMINVNGQNKAYAKLYGLGYKEVETPKVYQAGDKVGSELYKSSTKEVIQVLSNGVVKYGVLTWNNGVEGYVPYTNFDNVEDAAQYLTQKPVTATGIAVKPSQLVHTNLVDNFGFKLESFGAYVKGNQNIVFDSSGIVNYHYVGDMGETVTFAGFWKGKDLDKFIEKLEQNNPDKTFVHNSPIRIRAMLQTDEKLTKQLGYKWDEVSKQYFNKNDVLNTIVFTSDGSIYYYPTGGSGQNYKFSNEAELFSALEKEKRPQKESFYRDIMKVMLQ